MSRAITLPIFVLMFHTAICQVGNAQTDGITPQWIWHDEGNPIERAPAGSRFFRKTVRFDRIRVVTIDITCDNEFVLYLNGDVVGRGDDWQRVYTFDLTKQARVGTNVLAVQAKNWDGPAGLLVRGYAGWANGTQWTFSADETWRSTAEEQPRWTKVDFDDAAWPKAQVLGKYGKIGPWRALAWDSGYAGRFSVPEGFRIETVAPSSLTGSSATMAIDSQGRATVAPERGPATILEDTDGDGRYDVAKKFGPEITDSQGMYWIGRQLYISGKGPQGDGLYRITDSDGDDIADKTEQLTKYEAGIGGHGPHAIRLGPDGKLYHVLGNHAFIAEDESPTSPVLQRLLYEGTPLPRYEDPRGHAAGKRVPGGTIWSCDRDGNGWELIACGMRNPYDVAFNAAGELFTFDADMEWDFGLPWYRPTRVLHCAPGAEFGWRSGTAKWPSHYPDSLPAVADEGRGSPTGVVIYQHDHYPRKYRDSLWLGDWTNGEIVVHYLQQDGATYSSKAEVFATGEPMNVTGMDVGPDGSVYFCTGGWGTEGGVYRITWTGDGGVESIPPDASIEAAIKQPQLLAAWAVQRTAELRDEIGDSWAPALRAIASNSGRSIEDRIRAVDLLQIHGPQPDEQLALQLARDQQVSIRRRATILLAGHSTQQAHSALQAMLDDADPTLLRRASEALVQSGAEIEPDRILPLLAHEDRFVRYAGRQLLQRIEPVAWQETILAAGDADTVIEGLLALHSVDPGKDLERRLAKVLEVIESVGSGSRHISGALRVVQLLALSIDTKLPPSAAKLGGELLSRFPTGVSSVDWELVRLLARLQVEGGADKIVAQLNNPDTDRKTQVHYALCLRFLTRGWTPETSQAYLLWFQGKHRWEGGFSFSGYIQNILRDAVIGVPMEQRKQMVHSLGSDAPTIVATILQMLTPADLAAMTARLIELERSASGEISSKDAGYQEDMHALAAQIIMALGRSGSNEAKAYLRNLAEHDARDRQDLIVRSLAQAPVEADWPTLVHGLRSTNAQTLRVCIQALQKLESTPDDNVDAYRQLLLAGDRLGVGGGVLAVRLHNQWAGLKLSTTRQQWAEVAKEQKAWFARTFAEHSLTNAMSESGFKHQWKFEEILSHLTQKNRGRNGSVQRGRALFKQSQCIKCHRFEGEGNGIGPDLTTLSKRFKRKDIVTAVYYPSRDLNDQYKSVVVETERGVLFTGMLAPPEVNHVVLLQADGTNLKINKQQVVETTLSKVSAMPERGLDNYLLDEIADLIAFLESGKEAAPVTSQ